jgi:TorA maturation chaperone TorD
VTAEQLEQTEAVLAARRYLYTLFQSLFGNEPSSEQFLAISLPLSREAFVIVKEHLHEQGHSLHEQDGTPAKDATPRNGVVPAKDVAPTNGHLASALEEFLATLDAASKNPEDLKIEYTRLLIGPGKLPAPPWESVYTTGERVIFQRSTLEIRNFYRSQGLLPELYPKVADDHIALELDFLRLLAERALTAFQTNEQESYQEALTASSDFLNEHLLTWVGKFASDLVESEKGTFYPLAAQALARFIDEDAAVLRVLSGLKETG